MMYSKCKTYGEFLEGLDSYVALELENLLCGELELNAWELIDEEIHDMTILDWCIEEIGL